MSSSSVSFRISRNTEDLAETIHALSLRLVNMEQRLESLERRLPREAEEDPRSLASLSRVESLLQDCRDLLGRENEADPAVPLAENAAEAEPIEPGAAELQAEEIGRGRPEGFAAAA